MKNTRLYLFSALLGVMFAATGCSSNDEPKQAETGTLTRTLKMVDEDGKNYGTVELDPVGGGKVFDSDGRLIGRVVTP